MRIRRPLPALALAAALAAALSAPAVAAEFRSIATPAAVMYDGPSLRARKLFVAPRGMPVEVLSTLGRWVKVRDVAGDVVWVERSDLGEQRTVLAKSIVYVRQQPQDSAPIAFQVDRGVVLELVEPAATDGWLQVRHRDGVGGWVRVAEVWGH